MPWGPRTGGGRGDGIPSRVPHLRFENVRIYQSKVNPRGVILEALVTSDGNFHISCGRVIGWVYVTDADGYLIDKYQVESHTMLPASKYIHRETWEAPADSPSGAYQFHLDSWDPLVRWGKAVAIFPNHPGRTRVPRVFMLQKREGASAPFLRMRFWRLCAKFKL